MKILFDQGTPAPLRHFLKSHLVQTAYEKGWQNLQNGDLLAAAEPEFELLVTTDKNLRYQQNLSGRRLAILILPSTSWPRLQQRVSSLVSEIDSMQSGEYRELVWT